MKKGFWIILALMLMATITCSIGPTKDQERPATVIEVVNQVDAHPHPKDDWGPAEVDMAIYGGGQVRTRAESSAQLELLEGVVRLSADSVFTVKESATREGRLETSLFLEKGRVWAHLTTDQPHEFRVETPSAVAAVRDTHFSVEVGEDQRTRVSVAEGEVEVTAQGESVTVVAGQQTIVEPGQPPGPPEPMSDEERELWASEGEMPELAPPMPTPVPPKPTKPPEPTYLNMNLGGEPPTLDPALATDTTSVDLTECLFLGLTDYDDETSEVISELAESWEVSGDGLKWTFHMRQDVYWTKYDPASGKVEKKRPVTAHDVEYGVKRTLAPATASDYAYLLYIIENGEAVNTGQSTDLDSIGVSALDDYTIEFTLEEPAAYFPAIAGMWPARPVPQEVIEEYGDSWTEPQNIWTNGPYLLGTWEHDNKMVLVKNPEHPDAGDVQIDRINFFMVTEDSTALTMYENGELDVAGVPLPDLDRVKADPELSKELYIAPVLDTYYYGFNTTKPPVDNKHVRRALSYAIDRQKLIDTVLKGGQKPAKTFACPGIFGSPAEDPNFEGIEFDPDMAKKELELAGYPNGEGWPSDVVLMYNTSEGHQRIAEFIQANWKEYLGIEVELANQEWRVYLETLDQDAPQIFYQGWIVDYPIMDNFLYVLVFHSTKGSNRIKWSNSEFDQLTEQAAFETDPEKRKELYRRAEKVLCVDEAGIIPIYYYTRVVLTKPYVERTYAPLGGEHVYRWTVNRPAAMPTPVPPTPTPWDVDEEGDVSLTPAPTPTPTTTPTPTPTPTTTPTPTVTPTVTPTPGPVASDYAAEGLDHFVQGCPLLKEHTDCTAGIRHLQEAIRTCTAAVELDQNSAEGYFCLGMASSCLEEELNEAVQDLERALNLGLEGDQRAQAEQELEKLREKIAAPICVSMGTPIFAEDWDWDAGVPVNPGTNFPANSTREVWARWTLSNPCNEVAVVKWYHNGVHTCQHDTDELTGEYDGSGWTADEEWIETGEWCVAVYINDVEKTKGCFTVAEEVAPPPSSGAPEILSIEFPGQITADGTGFDGRVRFRDPEGDINWASFDVISAIDFGSFGFDPTPFVEGDPREGAFSFHTWCTVVQDVTMRVTLYDAAGNSSPPVDFSFSCQ
jgi:oligopeptide transport system substrate-binding protein